jgi:penicillin-binding protein 2
LVRLFFIQVATDKWKNESLSVSETKRTIQPSRGLIFDRNGKLLAANLPSYELHVTPKKVEPFDTTELCVLLNVSPERFIKKLKKLRKDPKSKQLIQKKIPIESIPKLNAILYRLKGFELDIKSARHYPTKSAAHLLGYIREVNSKTIEKKTYYRSGDLIGKSGIERYYEEVLRGKRGKHQYLKDVYGNLKEVLATDSAEVGKNITTTIDLDLQTYGERLMLNKIGGVVAIEPSTGEILAMVSAPTFNQDNLLTDSISSKFQPTFTRPLSSQYPPGSIFKMVQGLVSLELGAINQNTGLPCTKSLVGCHNHASARNLGEAIKYSCNPYFFQTLGLIASKMEGETNHIRSRKALVKWNEYVESFGLGVDLNLDIPYYKKGSIPSEQLYDRMYKNMGWNYRTFNSVSIGQGEVLITPIQMANLASVMANRGYFYYPHFARKIEGDTINPIYSKKNYTKVSSQYFPAMVDAMQQVLEGVGGTAASAKITGITVCGKTGTAQNPHGKDHSVFIAFAPKDNPKIAIAVYVENAGYGGTWAAPIASLMIENYLTDTIKNKYKEQRILDANLIPEIKK